MHDCFEVTHKEIVTSSMVIKQSVLKMTLTISDNTWKQLHYLKGNCNALLLLFCAFLCAIRSISKGGKNHCLRSSILWVMGSSICTLQYTSCCGWDPLMTWMIAGWEAEITCLDCAFTMSESEFIPGSAIISRKLMNLRLNGSQV